MANSPAEPTRAVSEAERFAAIPGQALAYKIGQLKILELRKRAEKALGKKFDVKAFHDEVLKDGAVPLDVLEAKIDRWIASKKLKRWGAVRCQRFRISSCCSSSAAVRSLLRAGAARSFMAARQAAWRSDRARDVPVGGIAPDRSLGLDQANPASCNGILACVHRLCASQSRC